MPPRLSSASLKAATPELRAQAAKALGEAPVKDPSRLIEALSDSSERVRFFAALSLGRLRVKEAFEPLLTLALYAADRNDPYLRHAAVVGLTGCASEQELLTLSGHALPAMRLSSLLALHRLRDTGVNRFLFDHTPEIRREAIRIIHDTPIEAARPALLAVVDELLQKRKLAGFSLHLASPHSFHLPTQWSGKRRPPAGHRKCFQGTPQRAQGSPPAFAAMDRSISCRSISRTSRSSPAPPSF